MATGMYSVWNYSKGAYDYYAGPPLGATHAGTPPRARGRTQVGSTPEQAAWPLPMGAKHVGSGLTPQGRISSMGDAGGVGAGLLDDVAIALPVVIGIAAVLYFTRKTR